MHICTRIEKAGIKIALLGKKNLLLKDTLRRERLPTERRFYEDRGGPHLLDSGIGIDAASATGDGLTVGDRPALDDRV